MDMFKWLVNQFEISPVLVDKLINNDSILSKVAKNRLKPQSEDFLDILSFDLEVNRKNENFQIIARNSSIDFRMKLIETYSQSIPSFAFLIYKRLMPMKCDIYHFKLVSVLYHVSNNFLEGKTFSSSEMFINPDDIIKLRELLKKCYDKHEIANIKNENSDMEYNTESDSEEIKKEKPVLSSRVSNSKKAPQKRLLESSSDDSDDEESVEYKFLSSSSEISSDHEPIRKKYIKRSNEDSLVRKPIVQESSSSSNNEDINNQFPPTRSMLSTSTYSENHYSADMKDLSIGAQYFSSDDNKKSESIDQKQSNATDDYSNDSNNQKQLQSNNSYESQNSESVVETKKYIGDYSSEDDSSNDLKKQKNNSGVYSSTDHQDSESEDNKRNNNECYPSNDSESNDSIDNRIQKHSVFTHSMDSTESESSDSMNNTHHKKSNNNTRSRVNPKYKRTINCKDYCTESSDDNTQKAVIIKPQGRKQKDPENPKNNNHIPTTPIQQRNQKYLCNESKNTRK